VVRHLTKSGTIFGLADFFTIVGIQSCMHCPWIMECKYTKLLHQNVNLGARFDVICHKVEWMKIHGSNESGLPLVQIYTKKIKEFLGMPKPLCPKWPNPLRMKFPLIFHQKQKFHSKNIPPPKISTHKEFYIPLTKVSSQNTTRIHPKVGPCQNPII